MAICEQSGPRGHKTYGYTRRLVGLGDGLDPCSAGLRPASDADVRYICKQESTSVKYQL